MQKYIFILVLFFFSNNYLISGQTLLNNDQRTIYNNLPQEKIFIHYNSTLLFSGDYLLYKVYNINTQTNKLSNLSKIAYIELIGKDKNYVFKHKINLKSGVGQNDFFIPTTVPSGNYKLIAYTNWMKNVGENNYFHGDISIINPFLVYQSEINMKSVDSITNIISSANENKINNQDKYVKLQVNNNIFNKREKVEIKVIALMNKSSHGNYSISVRKIDPIKAFHKSTTSSFNLAYPKIEKSNSFSEEKPIFLPEMRGELISGVVLEKETNKRVPLKIITLSITGKDPIFKSSITNSSGIFYFNLDKPYETLYAYLQVIDDNPEKYEIRINQNESLNYDGLAFSAFKITQDMEKLILERSINNQIENAFSAVKQNEIQSAEQVMPFYNGQSIIYNLDDFTRFKTVKETVVEIIDYASIEKRKGKNKFKVRIDQPTNKNLSSLIIVDGLLILNHDDLINYDARKIKKISVVPNRYKYGGKMFEGILSVQTINGDFIKNISSEYTKRIDLIKPQDNKIYFNQKYNGDNSLKRIPDFRNQLFWEPNFNLNQKESIITFYTSDYIGNYEVSIEGFTNNGIPISLNEIIEIQQ